MQWSDVVRRPSRTELRQFAALFLVVFLGMAAWRWFSGRPDMWAKAIAGMAVLVGVTGIAAPALVRPVYTGWMVAAFPIGWTISRLILVIVFFGILTPFAWVFRLRGRDELRLQRKPRDTYWRTKQRPAALADYFRQY